ncbi:MAG: hypothetical protein J7M26_09055 [Armatimonadetes bacterium]|nr:hypothetical protein [Armatimonadota bacterium]
MKDRLSESLDKPVLATITDTLISEYLTLELADVACVHRCSVDEVLGDVLGIDAVVVDLGTFTADEEASSKSLEDWLDVLGSVAGRRPVLVLLPADMEADPWLATHADIVRVDRRKFARPARSEAPQVAEGDADCSKELLNTLAQVRRWFEQREEEIQVRLLQRLLVEVAQVFQTAAAAPEDKGEKQ